MAKKPPPTKPWDITQADLDSITTPEYIHGTQRLLPPLDEIPKEFFNHHNIYVLIAEALYVGDEPPFGEVSFNPGFIEDGKHMVRAILAHIRCFKPEYEHKIAGIAYMISKIVRVTQIVN